jgi:CRP/FNR family cyclic AMP-dependent transcriptional regulator
MVAEGGMFGEIALIDGSSRSATGRAKAKCEVLPITEKDFYFGGRDALFALAVMRTLADRLRRTNERS